MKLFLRGAGGTAKSLISAALMTLILILSLSSAQARTMRLFVIGNSFSGNATEYLPQIVKERGHELVIQRAQVGGCSLERHWKAVEADQANPAAPEGKIYGGKSLREMLGVGTWDVVVVQQYSLLSGDVATYRPFGQKLHDYIKVLQPAAEVVVHQTWAYRSDAKSFGLIAPQKKAQNQQEMWQHSRAAYRQIARELNARLIPTGDAFWRVDSDPQWGYKPDNIFDFQNPQLPALPDQAHSLHIGYRWNEKKELGMDANHANTAGCYLGALVWYGFLFHESPLNVTFVPQNIPSDFAAHLRTVAGQIVQEEARQRPIAAS
jgi:hypothetical protein